MMDDVEKNIHKIFESLGGLNEELGEQKNNKISKWSQELKQISTEVLDYKDSIKESNLQIMKNKSNAKFQDDIKQLQNQHIEVKEQLKQFSEQIIKQNLRSNEIMVENQKTQNNHQINLDNEPCQKLTCVIRSELTEVERKLAQTNTQLNEQKTNFIETLMKQQILLTSQQGQIDVLKVQAKQTIENSESNISNQKKNEEIQITQKEQIIKILNNDDSFLERMRTFVKETNIINLFKDKESLDQTEITNLKNQLNQMTIKLLRNQEDIKTYLNRSSKGIIQYSEIQSPESYYEMEQLAQNMDIIFKKYNSFRWFLDENIGKGKQWIQEINYRKEFQEYKLAIYPKGLKFIHVDTLTKKQIHQIMKNLLDFSIRPITYLPKANKKLEQGNVYIILREGIQCKIESLLRLFGIQKFHLTSDLNHWIIIIENEKIVPESTWSEYCEEKMQRKLLKGQTKFKYAQLAKVIGEQEDKYSKDQQQTEIKKSEIKEQKPEKQQQKEQQKITKEIKPQPNTMINIGQKWKQKMDEMEKNLRNSQLSQDSTTQEKNANQIIKIAQEINMAVKEDKWSETSRASNELDNLRHKIDTNKIKFELTVSEQEELDIAILTASIINKYENYEISSNLEYKQIIKDIALLPKLIKDNLIAEEFKTEIIAKKLYTSIITQENINIIRFTSLLRLQLKNFNSKILDNYDNIKALQKIYDTDKQDRKKELELIHIDRGKIINKQSEPDRRKKFIKSYMKYK